MNRATIARASRSIMVLALVFSAVSCAHWRQQWVGPEMVVRQNQPKEVLLTRKDGTQLRFKNPAVVPDSLVGTVGEERRAIALRDVDHLSLRRGRPLLPAVLIPLGVILGLTGLIAATWD
jgi:hypothetical protein